MMKKITSCFLIFIVVIGLAHTHAQAYEIFERDPKSGVNSGDCSMPCNCTCKAPIQNNHKEIRAHVTDELIKHRRWMIDELFATHVLPAMRLMTSQLSVVAVQQIQMIGGFFDAKHQLETQQLFQQLTAEAHKDYQPSEGLCDIGTNIRSLTASEKKSRLVKVAISDRLMDRQLRSGDNVAGAGLESDKMSRLYNFIDTYCNKSDNTSGLTYLCQTGQEQPARMNKDINFTRTVESELTLDIDLIGDAVTEQQPDKEDVFALTANLFGHKPLPAFAPAELASVEGEPKSMAMRYMDLRSITAKRSVAQNALSSLLAQRASGDEEVAPYLKKLIMELDLSPEDAEEILGEKPSYFAQMEVLTKDLYQNPKFYTELYDKPANVLRKSAALHAISLMQDRDIFESQLRSEAVLAVTLESMLQEEKRRLDNELQGLEVERN